MPKNLYLFILLKILFSLDLRSKGLLTIRPVLLFLIIFLIPLTFVPRQISWHDIASNNDFRYPHF